MNRASVIESAAQITPGELDLEAEAIHVVIDKLDDLDITFPPSSRLYGGSDEVLVLLDTQGSGPELAPVRLVDICHQPAFVQPRKRAVQSGIPPHALVGPVEHLKGQSDRKIRAL